MIDVLLVHDDVERCTAIRNAIKANPELNLISETQTGREGLFAAATMLTGHPRMLIVRLNLGDMTGFDFIAQVRQKAHDIYIIPALEGTEGVQVVVDMAGNVGHGLIGLVVDDGVLPRFKGARNPMRSWHSTFGGC